MQVNSSGLYPCHLSGAENMGYSFSTMRKDISPEIPQYPSRRYPRAGQLSFAPQPDCGSCAPGDLQGVSGRELD